MVRAATHEKVSAAMLVCVNAATHRARHYDLTPLITDVANGKPASVLHMLSSHVRIAVDCQFEPLEQSCTINAPRDAQILCTARGSAGRQQGQVVAALVIRDAVGDAISPVGKRR